ncbi:MAG: BadF/BadG/BcrA/BcrD ATPase family protein [Candidatus Paceibacterota bacterium]|jgi:N-acetylglucosamine kinase-like BadF-type ATPase
MKTATKISREKALVIGVDGGGTKTLAILADLDGKILRTAVTGASNPRNVGIKMSAENVGKAIKKVLGRREEKISSVFVALPAMEEEYKGKEAAIKKEILRYKDLGKFLKGEIAIGSDQIASFRSGTDSKEGILAIAGTGCVARGWREDGRQEKSSGWGWFGDEGSAFWIGQRVFQEVMKDADGREDTLMSEIILKELKAKTVNDLSKMAYKYPFKIIPLLSSFCDQACEKGEEKARNILTEAAGEIALSVNTVFKNLDFHRKVPLVLVGGVFKSKTVLKALKEKLGKNLKMFDIILPELPAEGAVKLAIERYEKKEN